MAKYLPLTFFAIPQHRAPSGIRCFYFQQIASKSIKQIENKWNHLTCNVLKNKYLNQIK